MATVEALAVHSCTIDGEMIAFITVISFSSLAA
jgi:hypothetical protein